MSSKLRTTGNLLLGAVTYFMLGPLNPQPAKALPPRTPHSVQAPASPTGPQDQVVKAEVIGVPFEGFLKYKSYRVELVEGGQCTHYTGGFVHGPGHHISAIAALAFDEQMKPHPILKSGDTRLSRADRQKPYVQDGFIAGRMDKVGAESSKIALAELAEEVGGEVVPGTFQPLGQRVVPTMPFESTESDAYFMAAVHISGNPFGDGGSMELTDLIGPKIMTTSEAIRAMDEGKVSEASRTRTMFGRSFDAIGYIPQLEVYVQEHPALASRFDTLGLGPVVDLRVAEAASRFPEPKTPGDNLESRVNHVVCSQRQEVALSDQARMVNAKTRHAVNENGVITPLDAEFANQYLQLDYDRAKIGTYYIDPQRGPMLQMTRQARPALAFAPESPDVLRLDVADIQIRKDEETAPEGSRPLGNASGASAGQTDLYYHFFAREVTAPEHPDKEGFLPLAQAIRLCREGQGDAQTEALCERLADDLQWIPNLEMSVDQARKLLAGAPG